MTEQRTAQQNKALHQYFTMLAKDLNDAGLDIRKTLKEDFEISWTPEAVKELIWKPILKVMFGELSTADMETDQVGEVYLVIARHMAQKGITTPFPDRFSLADEQLHPADKNFVGKTLEREQRWKEVGDKFRAEGEQ